MAELPLTAEEMADEAVRVRDQAANSDGIRTLYAKPCNILPHTWTTPANVCSIIVHHSKDE